MKQISLPFMAILLFPWLACNNSSTHPTAMTAGRATAIEAAMLLPTPKTHCLPVAGEISI